MAKEIHPDDLLECPYDPVHMIRAKRMQYHLLKCRQNHDCHDMARCPFNASHEVYKAELRYHMGMCEDRHKVQSRIIQEFQDSSEMMGCVETPGYTALHIAGDSWEHEILRSIPVDTADTSRVKEEPKKVVRLSEAEVQGLNLRQRRALYLKRKTELEVKVKNAEDSRSGGIAGLPAPRQLSQSLALHQQQIQQQQQPDIYQFMHKAPGGVGRGLPRAAPLSGQGSEGSAGGLRPGAQPPPLSASSAGKAMQPGSSGDSFDNAEMPVLIRQTQFLSLGLGRGSPAAETVGPLGAAAGFVEGPSIVPGRAASLRGADNSGNVPVSGGFGQRGWGAAPSFSMIVAGQRSSSVLASNTGLPASQPSLAARTELLYEGRGRGSAAYFPEAALGASCSSRSQQIRAPWLEAGDSDSDSAYQDALSQPGIGEVGYLGGYSSSLTAGGGQYFTGSWADDVDRAYPLGGSSGSGSTPSNSDTAKVRTNWRS